MSFFRKLLQRVDTIPPLPTPPSPEPPKAAPLFPVFSTLPTELQIKIWNYYLHSPPNRAHAQHSRLYKYYPYADARSWENPVYWTPCVDVFAAMHVCHLSRKLAWDFYLSLPLSGSSSAAMKSHEYLAMNKHFCQYGYKKPGPGLDKGQEEEVVEGSYLDEVRMLVVECKYWDRVDLGGSHNWCPARMMN